MAENDEKLNNINQLARVRAFFAGRRLDASDLPQDSPAPPTLGDEPASTSTAIELVAPPSTPLSPYAGGAPNAYALYLATRRSARAAQTMREGLDRAARLLPGGPYDAPSVPWERLGPEGTAALVAALWQANYSPATVNLTLAAVKGVLRQAWKLGLLTQDALARATDWGRIPDNRRGTAGREIPQEELVKLAAYVRGLGPDGQNWPRSAYGAMLEAVFALMLGTGMRASEVGLMPLRGLSNGKPLGFYGDGVRFLAKGNKERACPLTTTEIAALEQWLAVRSELEPKSDRLLVRVMPDGKLIGRLDRRTIAYLCEVVARGAGIKPFSPHDCRRTFGTRSIRQTHDLMYTQRSMGHASPATTGIYDKRGEEEDARIRREQVTMWPSKRSK